MAIATIGFGTFTCLLVRDHIDSLAYVALLGLLAIVCMVLPLQNRLRELDVKNLKLTLEKIEDAKEEIYAKEESLRESAYLLADVMAVNSVVAPMLGDKESFEYGAELVKNRIEKLGKNLNIPQNRIDDLFKIERALADLQQYKGEEREAKWLDFKELLKSEARKDA